MVSDDKGVEIVGSKVMVTIPVSFDHFFFFFLVDKLRLLILILRGSNTKNLTNLFTLVDVVD